jgi:hypothetical protein
VNGQVRGYFQRGWAWFSEALGGSCLPNSSQAPGTGVFTAGRKPSVSRDQIAIADPALDWIG